MTARFGPASSCHYWRNGLPGSLDYIRCRVSSRPIARATRPVAPTWRSQPNSARSSARVSAPLSHPRKTDSSSTPCSTFASTIAPTRILRRVSSRRERRASTVRRRRLVRSDARFRMGRVQSVTPLPSISFHLLECATRDSLVRPLGSARVVRSARARPGRPRRHFILVKRGGSRLSLALRTAAADGSIQ